MLRTTSQSTISVLALLLSTVLHGIILLINNLETCRKGSIRTLSDTLTLKIMKSTNNYLSSKNSQHLPQLAQNHFLSLQEKPLHVNIFFMRQSGSSLIEVVVMMVIMSVSIVGIYSLVNSGQRLAKTTDDRLIATNLAKEGLESVGALRDTFNLKAYDADDCFFTIDASNLDNTKCYQDGVTTGTKYFLKDDKTLTTTSIEKPVCINTEGWYSQELSKTGADCSNANDTPRCG